MVNFTIIFHVSFVQADFLWSWFTLLCIIITPQKIHQMKKLDDWKSIHFLSFFISSFVMRDRWLGTWYGVIPIAWITTRVTVPRLKIDLLSWDPTLYQWRLPCCHKYCLSLTFQIANLSKEWILLQFSLYSANERDNNLDRLNIFFA